MKYSVLGISLIAATVALSGCSSMGIGKKEFTEIEKTETGVDKVPTWYVTPQEDQGPVIFGSGTGLSDDLQFSMDKAMHEAKLVLADKMSSKASASVDRYITDSAAGGQSKTIRKTEKLSSTGFDKINVGNYAIVNRAVFKEKTFYRTYVLLKLNKDDIPSGAIPAISMPIKKKSVKPSPFIEETVPNNGQFFPVN
jgi:hypothetical protein